MKNNNIREAGAKSLAEAIKKAKILLTLNLCKNILGDAGAIALVDAMVQNTDSSAIKLDLSESSITDKGIQCIANLIKLAKVPLTLKLGHNSIYDSGASALAKAINEVRVPLDLSVGTNVCVSTNITEDGKKLLDEAMENNFVVEARKNPSAFLKRIKFSTSKRIIEQALCCPSVLAELVQGYIGSDNDIAWIDIAAIRAVEGASHNNKYNSINYKLLEKAYQLCDEENRTVGDGGASGSSSSSSSSSSAGSPPPGGGANDATDISDQETTRYLSDNVQHINYDLNQASDNRKESTAENAAENLLKKLLTWIKEMPEELQQQMLSSFSVQQVLKFLGNTLTPNKFIEDKLRFQITQEKFETEQKPYSVLGNFTDASQEYAKISVAAPVSLDNYASETLSNGIFMDLDPLQKLPAPLGLDHSFGAIGQLDSM